jgi:hypothetical protein
MSRTRSSAGERQEEERAYCVRCKSSRRFAEPPRKRRRHNQWQLTGICERCGAPIHLFVSESGESGETGGRKDTRSTVKVSQNVHEVLQLASGWMYWSQPEIVEYLVREHLQELIERVLADPPAGLPPCPARLRRFVSDDEADGGADDEGSEDEGPEDEGVDAADRESPLVRFWRRLTSG